MVSIITVNFNAADQTCALLESIRQLHDPLLQVIVVDNGSRIDPGAEFLKQFPFITYLRSEQNLGFAGGNNLALQVAQGDYLFFINNDAEITQQAIPRLVSLLQNNPKAGIVSPLICFHPASQPNAAAGVIQYAGMTAMQPFTGRNRMLGRGELNRGQYNRPFQTAYAHGAAMMIPRKVLETVGPLSEDYFLYYEELDWCERIRKAGYDVWVEPNAMVWHRESATMNTMGAIKTFYMTRNRIRFMQRHFGGWRFWIFKAYFNLVAAPKQAFSSLLRLDWPGMGAFFRGAVSR